MQTKPESQAWLRLKALGDSLKKDSATDDRHYTEAHRLQRCTCWSPDQWPKEVVASQGATVDKVW